MAALIERLRARPDFRRHPLRALWRRLWWRVRWRLDRRPWMVAWHDGLRIALPRSGPAALIYYQGLSEPDTADLLRALLGPGMVFVDVGAHIGEYTLLGARRVGDTGEVHAFEPDPRAHAVLVENVRLNRLSRVVTRPWAVSEAEGEAELRLHAEPALSALATPLSPVGPAGESRRVPRVTLDGYIGERRLDVVKIDVEGAEMLVVRGARRLLARPAAEAPVLVFECAGHNYARFGYAPADLFRLLAGHGYSVCRYDSPGGLRLLDGEPAAGVTLNLVAAKDAERLATRLGTP
jgi:FkbM family methyltransferase